MFEHATCFYTCHNINIDHSGAIASKRHLLDVVGSSIFCMYAEEIASKEGCENVRKDAKERCRTNVSGIGTTPKFKLSSRKVPPPQNVVDTKHKPSERIPSDLLERDKLRSTRTQTQVLIELTVNFGIIQLFRLMST